MSAPYRYFGAGTHMSAVLKQEVRRVRANRPDLYKTQLVRESSMDGEGKVTVKVVENVRAVPSTPARRHALSLQVERY